MGAKRNGLLALLAAIAFIATGMLAAQAQDTADDPAAEIAPRTAPPIDYEGFLALSEEVAALRAERLVDLHAFQRMASDPNTIILDTRSREAFAAGHLDGAINLPFSDFTETSLSSLIPSTDTRILIYCNNNFIDDVAPVMIKRASLALNIPTFVNLVGYGYDDVYELADAVSMDDPEIYWVAAPKPSTD